MIGDGTFAHGRASSPRRRAVGEHPHRRAVPPGRRACPGDLPAPRRRTARSGHGVVRTRHAGPLPDRGGHPPRRCVVAIVRPGVGGPCRAGRGRSGTRGDRRRRTPCRWATSSLLTLRAGVAAGRGADPRRPPGGPLGPGPDRSRRQRGRVAAATRAARSTSMPIGTRRATRTWAAWWGATRTASPARASSSTGRPTSWCPTRDRTSCTAVRSGSTDVSGRGRRSTATATTRVWSLRLRSDDGDQGFPGRVDVAGDLPTDGVGRAAHRRRGGDGCADGAERDQPLVLEPGRAPPRRVRTRRSVRTDCPWPPTGWSASTARCCRPASWIPVEGSVFDLRAPVALGELLDRSELRAVGGLDHCLRAGRRRPVPPSWSTPAAGGASGSPPTSPACRCTPPTTAPARCPATQRCAWRPSTCRTRPNQPGFPSAVLRPGATYRHTHVVRVDIVDR